MDSELDRASARDCLGQVVVGRPPLEDLTSAMNGRTRVDRGNRASVVRWQLLIGSPNESGGDLSSYPGSPSLKESRNSQSHHVALTLSAECCRARSLLQGGKPAHRLCCLAGGSRGRRTLRRRSLGPKLWEHLDGFDYVRNGGNAGSRPATLLCVVASHAFKL
jgi:hypothetical protein